MNRQELKETHIIHRSDDLDMNIYRNRGSIYCHWHDEYEFIYIEKGACECFIEGVPYRIGECEAVLIGGGQLHSVSAERDVISTALVLHPHICGNDCMSFFSKNIAYDPLICRDDTVNRAIIENLLRIHRAFEAKEPGYPLRLKALIADSFALMLENGHYTDTKTNYASDAFKSLISYIHSCYKDKITLDDLSKISNYSKPHIINLFKRSTSKTPLEYINSYRVYKSLELLSNTDMTVLQVGLECGFDNSAYFIKNFKKHIGKC